MLVNQNEQEGPEFNEHERKLYETAQLAEDLVAGLLGFDAALSLLADERVLALVPPTLPGKLVPIGSLPHIGNDEGHEYHFTYYLDRLRTEPNRTLTKRLWASSVLLRLGEKLTRHAYFDRHPSLELVRHIRNAVAHGERFLIRDPLKLSQFPAFLTAGSFHWKITPELDGTPLYERFSAGDIGSIVQSVGIHLNNMALARHVQR